MTTLKKNFLVTTFLFWAAIPASSFSIRSPKKASLSLALNSRFFSLDSLLKASTQDHNDDGYTEDGDQTTEEYSPSVLVGPDLPPIGPNSKRLFLVRHGEVINPGGDRPVFYGSLDVSLSPLGEAEAKAAAAYLQQYDLEYVVSSPLSRAIFGANQVCLLQKDLSEENLVILDGFKELDRGSWCSKTKDEIGLDMLARFDACDESVTPEGGESYPFLKKRVLNARDTVLEMLSKGRAAAIVSHLQVTRSMLSDALGIPTNEMAALKVATASITCIDYDLETATQTVHFQSFKPEVGLAKSNEGVYN